MWSIVLAAISLGLGILSLGLAFLFTVPLALGALALALASRRDRERRPGQVRAALILSVIAVAACGLAAAIWLALDASGFSPNDLRDWLEEELERQQRRRGGGRDGPGEI